MRRPAVFLFDEPLSNLDAALRAQLRVEIKRLHQRLGTTTVYVTHDQVEAMTLADRIAVLEGGRMQQVGSPLELYEEPRNRFVAGFMGSPAMSFLHQVEPGRVVGVRPHDVVVGEGALQAEVDVVETMGFESFVHLSVGGERLVARVEGAPPAKGKANIGFRRVYRFDPASGARLP